MNETAKIKIIENRRSKALKLTGPLKYYGKGPNRCNIEAYSIDGHDKRIELSIDKSRLLRQFERSEQQKHLTEKDLSS